MMLRRVVKVLPLLALVMGLSGCFGSEVRQQLNICEELDNYDEWIEATVSTQLKYGTPISLSLALLELPLSDLDKKHVRPRAADWDEYRIRSERWGASPHEAEDAVDFIGWFTQQSGTRNSISWDDVSAHYLALRLGHGDYQRFDKSKFPELNQQAQQVELRAQRWQRELTACKQQWQNESWYNKLKFW
ncbi:hypothetical protein [Pseudoalteromonas sp.]|uniref:transglycosylase SLT domain-containing protein n=1 Tax=Pseudoalteromonas sp. TaxID=53249 RepID=UPI00261486CC|nr:hypothetical protein [Pseudoalteromonas sp.]MCP4588775.1 hypothetical protein [Pseudoalteromonas sp.]